MLKLMGHTKLMVGLGIPVIVLKLSSSVGGHLRCPSLQRGYRNPWIKKDGFQGPRLEHYEIESTPWAMHQVPSKLGYIMRF